MADDPSSTVALVAQERILRNREAIKQTMANVAAGNPLASEKVPERLVARLMAKTDTHRQSELVRMLDRLSQLPRDS